MTISPKSTVYDSVLTRGYKAHNVYATELTWCSYLFLHSSGSIESRASYNTLVAAFSTSHFSKQTFIDTHN